MRTIRAIGLCRLEGVSEWGNSGGQDTLNPLSAFAHDTFYDFYAALAIFEYERPVRLAHLDGLIARP